MFSKVDPRPKFDAMEKGILKYWEKEKIFPKSLAKRKDAKTFTFYDGPPFANGLPHYGHILPTAIKDAVLRFWTMKGYLVERRVGWDTHGLPVEYEIEKELGLKGKREIEEKIGIEEFNEACRASVFKYSKNFEETLKRVGRWADYENAYATLNTSYTESVWWVFKQLWDRGLVYEGYRVTPYCPRCGTPLSNFEVNQGYKEVDDQSVYVRFEINSEKFKDTSFLVWTTTPWTLPGNTALAVGKDIVYILAENKNEKLILAKDRLEALDDSYQVKMELKGSDLAGLEYEPLYDNSKYVSQGKEANDHKVWTADFVSVEDGTGIVHIAPAFGEDDMNLRNANDFSVAMTVDLNGEMLLDPGKGKFVKDADNEIKNDLKKRGLLYKEEMVHHTYPFCWRCETPLLYMALATWYIAVTKFQGELTKNNEKISWVPAHLKKGRFGKWLEGAKDWAVSRSRFWGAPIPIWRCDKCKDNISVGSLDELEKLSGKRPKDLHRPFIDKVSWSCKCGGEFKRVPDVFDCWFESGAMPYAQWHYPFENKELVEKTFPADFIAEGLDQTRGWFYTLHVLASALTQKDIGLGKSKPAYKNVIVNGIMLAQDGAKLSKRAKNYRAPEEVISKYGADSLRYSLLASPLTVAKDVKFNEQDVKKALQNIVLKLWNVYSFFVTYANIDKWQPSKDKGKAENVLDRWILSELQGLVRQVDENMQKYELNRAVRPIEKFIDNLSNWYVRRSRRRFWKSENDEDKKQAYQTLYTVLATLSKVLAPFTPFVSEEIYRNLTGEESVHLEDFPETDNQPADKSLSLQMKGAREVVEIGLAIRAEKKIKVRQPLAKLIIRGADFIDEINSIIRDEVNVKEIETVIIGPQASPLNEKLEVELDINITEELKKEGQAREIVRAIQSLRKEADYNLDDRIAVFYEGADEIFGDSEMSKYIAQETLAESIGKGRGDVNASQEIKIDEIEVWLGVKKKSART